MNGASIAKGGNKMHEGKNVKDENNRLWEIKKAQKIRRKRGRGEK